MYCTRCPGQLWKIVEGGKPDPNDKVEPLGSVNPPPKKPLRTSEKIPLCRRVLLTILLIDPTESGDLVPGQPDHGYSGIQCFICETNSWQNPRSGLRPHVGHFTSTTAADVARCNSLGGMENTANGVPAAAQMCSYANKSLSIQTDIGRSRPTGGIPPMAYPVAFRTKSGVARSIGSPTRSASARSFTRFVPLTMTSNGWPLLRP